MKYIILVSILFCVSGLSAQITNQGEPHSWSFQLKRGVSSVVMQPINLNKLKAEDTVNDVKREIPFRFGYEFDVDLGFNDGVWEKLPNGGRIWRITIISEGAKTLNFVFDQYKVPDGATIYFYNKDRSNLLGAYTNVFNRPDEMLGTWLVEGSEITIEYYEPDQVKGQGKLNLSKVVHGYRSVTDLEARQKALGDSGDCNHDVDCTIGEDFDCIKDKLKKSVGFIILNGFVCTGTLINNTNNDRAPYFLTANHCESGSTATWAFRFNWISPDPSCGSTTGSTDTNVNQTTSGATILASNSESDFKLLNLDGGLDNSWDIEWAGWDRTGDIPDYVVGIHHPAGDIMKICREDQSPSEFVIDFNGNPTTKVWQIDDWDIGVTEQGSSGSAIFDKNGRIVGQLAGGEAACDAIDSTVDNNQPDYYGRFQVSWNFGNTNETRLSNWLDPTNTSRERLNMLSQELEGLTSEEVDNIECVEVNRNLVITPNPSLGVVNIINDVPEIQNYITYDVFGKVVSQGQITAEDQSIDLSAQSSGMYFIYLTNTSDGRTFTKRVIVR